MAKKIMAWSKCKIEIGQMGDNDAMASSFTDVGVILNQSSSLSAEEGDKMQAIATGGEVVAEEPQEGTLVLETTIIEPTPELIALLGLSMELAASPTEVVVKTHVVEGNWSVKVTPKNNGAWGIQAPKTTITYIPAWSEENGNQAVLRFAILKTTEVTEVLKKKTANGWETVTSGTPTGYVAAEADLPATASTDTIYSVGGNYWYKRFKTSSSL